MTHSLPLTTECPPPPPALQRTVSRPAAEWQPPKATRLKQLDILRAIAVLLVLGRNVFVNRMWYRAGWVGVDLFFVLSGFLISGLLFTEYQKYRRIDFARFFVRRGLKIYPAFYLLILITVLVGLGLRHPASFAEVASELFFYQNYAHGLWGHTWSLAVEEHFYILLPVCLLILSKRAAKGSNPFQILPRAFVPIALFILLLRIITYLTLPFRHQTHYNPTHLRVDSMYFGVVLSYYFHFQKDALRRFLRPRSHRIALALFSALLISPCIFLTFHSFFTLTFGFTFLYLGFGALLLLSLLGEFSLPGGLRRIGSRVGSGLARIGSYSYSIYLWHVPVAVWGLHRLHKIWPKKTGTVTDFVLYLIASIGVGIFMANLIEFPVLKLRDRLFPARNTNLTTALKGS